MAEKADRDKVIGMSAKAFERAVASGMPAIIHVKIDPEAITPTTTLSAIRRKALAAREG